MCIVLYIMMVLVQLFRERPRLNDFRPGVSFTTFWSIFVCATIRITRKHQVTNRANRTQRMCAVIQRGRRRGVTERQALHDALAPFVVSFKCICLSLYIHSATSFMLVEYYDAILLLARHANTLFTDYDHLNVLCARLHNI